VCALREEAHTGESDSVLAPFFLSFLGFFLFLFYTSLLHSTLLKFLPESKATDFKDKDGAIKI
jgi:hypothetical protein